MQAMYKQACRDYASNYKQQQAGRQFAHHV